MAISFPLDCFYFVLNVIIVLSLFMFSGFVKASDLLVLPLDQSALRDTVEQLRHTPVGLDSVLGRTVPFGVAYHHAGDLKRILFHACFL